MDRQRSVGIREVAAHAGVSDSTVSNVINRPEIVAAATVERVTASMAELGYVVNAAARQLRLGGGSTLGMIVTDIANPFIAEMANDCEDAAEEAEFSILLGSTDGKPEREDRYLRMFEEQRTRGLLVLPQAGVRPSLNALAARGMPIVVLGTQGDPSRFCTVIVDDVAGGVLATTHLLEQGRRDIVFIGDSEQVVLDRLQGARQAGGDAVRRVEIAHNTFDEGRRVVDGWRDGELPDAVFAANDSAAIGVLHGLLARGVGVPGRVAIVGYDDAEIARQAIVPLTSVRQPRTEVAAHGIRLVLDHVARGSAHRHAAVKLRPELVVRSTSSS